MHYHHDGSERHHFRCWLHFGQRGSCARLAVDWWSCFCFLEIDSDPEDGIGVAIALPPLAFWFSINPPWRVSYDRRVAGLRIHSGALWWKVWTSDHEWSSRTPKWRGGNFHFIDFLIGRAKCTTSLIETREVSVPMPEGCYAATANLMLYEWHRARWFTKRMHRVEIDIPQGIPHEGKGENSWDCGADATFRLTTGECNSIPDGVGQLVGSVLRSRVRYGGWKDWNWHRESAST